MSEKLVLIDAMAMIYRAYFALISHPLMNSQGRNTSAVFGFVNSILKIIDEQKPDHIAVCFDTEAPTFRHKEYPKYKAQREEIPTDMPWQIVKVKEIVKAFNIPSIELDGYEADDIIGTLVKQAEKEKVISYMVTPDKDFMQLVSDLTFMYKPSRNIYGNQPSEVEIIDKSGVAKKFGVTPEKVIEVLGLMGDASDNIPGVKGIGEKTATALIQEFGTIDNIYANLDSITKAKLKENLINYKKDAYLARKLVTIATNVPLHINFHDLNRKIEDRNELRKLFTELDFKSLAKKYSDTQKKIGTSEPGSGSNGVLIPEEIISREDDDNKQEIKITITGNKIENIKVDIPESKINRNTIETVQHKYYTIKNHSEYDRLITKLSSEELISFDTETTGLEPTTAGLVGMSFSYQEKEAFYVPVKNDIPSDKKANLFEQDKTSEKDSIGVELDYAIKKLKPVLESKTIKKVGQNIKFDYLIMRNHGIEMENIYFDSMVGAYLLNPQGAFNMDELSEKYLNYKPVKIEELIGKGKEQLSMSDVDINIISEYAAEDADVTLQLFHKIRYELQKINLQKLCSEIEIPLIKVLAEMEFEGVKVDLQVLKSIDNEITRLIFEYENNIYKLAGEKFNINSPKQLSEILFKKLNLVPTKKTKTGLSTDVSVLEDLKNSHPIAETLLEFRSLTKLKSTYIEGLSKSIDAKTGRIHTSYLQTITSTGRLSSVNPNLQNIPVKTEIGRGIRKAFIPKNRNFVIFSADYSQIELRIMAHYSEDENFINAFKKNRDIHTETAMRVFQLENKKDMTPAMRRRAKEVNFGIIYGIGAFGLANRLEIKNSEAKDIIDRYFREFPRVKEYMEKTKKFARENGYVQTLKGRRRYLPQINNQNPAARAEDERAAINMPIQGTAADMIKIAMIDIFDELKENKFESRMLIQVHDELVFEVKKIELEEVKKIVIKNMKNAIKLNVPIEVEVGEGNSWYEAH
jgi:DNA polymerase I